MNPNQLVEWHFLLDEWLKIRGVNFLLGKRKELVWVSSLGMDKDDGINRFKNRGDVSLIKEIST